MDIGKQVCSCSVELRCSAEERLVVGQGEGVRETRIEKLDNALRKSRDEPLFDFRVGETEKEEGLKGLFEVKQYWSEITLNCAMLITLIPYKTFNKINIAGLCFDNRKFFKMIANKC